ncbi:MAG: hypothetical protein LQ340_004850 [Diploschistes diacapsis]|nr:MAG: hypothetical protein LQ340_004850 [Diploschistes diacapsis]
MACLNCRRRKLKCSKTLPVCSTCTKTGRECVYDVQPKKRGPKKRDLKALEERLEYLERGIRVEAPISTQSEAPDLLDAFTINEKQIASTLDLPSQGREQQPVHFCSNSLENNAFLSHSAEGGDTSAGLASGGPPTPFSFPDFDIFGFDFSGVNFGDLPVVADTPSPRDSQALIDIYFQYAHPFGPIIHKERFLQGEPPMCLRYAVWAVGALWSTEFRDKIDGFYRKARACLDEDEMFVNDPYASAGIGTDCSEGPRGKLCQPRALSELGSADVV